MTTYTTLLVTGPIQDGYLLPRNSAAFSQLTIGTKVHSHMAFTSPTDNAVVLAINTALTLTPLYTGNVITVERASDIKVRLVSPRLPKANDILLLLNGYKTGLYQFVVNTWVYRGEVVSSSLPASTVSTGLSTGFINNQPFTGLTAQVKKVDVLPDELMPYKVYANRVTGLIYFPYVTANSYQYPYAIVSAHAPALVSQLIEEQVVVISPCGYNQLDSLPKNTDYIFLTYSSLSTPSVRQPISVFSSAHSPILYSTVIPTSLSVDYSILSGVSDTAYQLASGYFRGANNLWDVVVSDYGLITTGKVRQITPTSTYVTAIADLMLTNISSNVKTSKMQIYIGKETSISSDNVLFTLDVAFTTTKRLSNIRLAAGEAIYCSASPAINYNYRYTILARSF
jgi:hypothetical protein